MRQIFFPQPVHTLSQHMTIQIQIRKVVDNQVLMRTPLVIEIVLKHLEALVDSNHFSKKKIFASFYDLDNQSTFGKVWDDLAEIKLKSLKEEINAGSVKVFHEPDTRVVVQLMLDFIESLKEPAISRTTVSHLAKQVNTGMSSHEILNDQLSGHYLIPRDPSMVCSCN